MSFRVKGICLLFLPNVPGATFIQGGTFIPDSRVNIWKVFKNRSNDIRINEIHIRRGSPASGQMLELPFPLNTINEV